MEKCPNLKWLVIEPGPEFSNNQTVVLSEWLYAPQLRAWKTNGQFKTVGLPLWKMNWAAIRLPSLIFSGNQIVQVFECPVFGSILYFSVHFNAVSVGKFCCSLWPIYIRKIMKLVP
jgi:hypothetical protein